MSDTKILIVNENDEPIGAATIDQAREQGSLHRISRVMVEDSMGKILLQKRSPMQIMYPNFWDNSGAGHVDEGENYEEAALRELEEEMGIAGFPLEEVAYYRTSKVYKNFKINRFNKLYKVSVPAGTPFRVQEEEVSEGRWFTVQELRQLVELQPPNLTDGLKDALFRLYGLGSNNEDYQHQAAG